MRYLAILMIIALLAGCATRWEIGRAGQEETPPPSSSQENPLAEDGFTLDEPVQETPMNEPAPATYPGQNTAPEPYPGQTPAPAQQPGTYQPQDGTYKPGEHAY